MCIFDLCEFNNLIIGSIVGGLVGLVLVIIYEWLVNKRRMNDLARHFQPLESRNQDTFDWTCFDINGRERSKANGSMASVKYLTGHQLEIRVKEPNGSTWVGQITMTDKARGLLTFNYVGKYEYGYKDCYLGQELDNGVRYDYWILVGDGKSYFNELVRRERK
jgi:hypothetical protein